MDVVEMIEALLLIVATDKMRIRIPLAQTC